MLLTFGAVDSFCITRPGGFIREPWETPARGFSGGRTKAISEHVLREALSDAVDRGEMGVVVRQTQAEMQRQIATLTRERDNAQAELRELRRQTAATPPTPGGFAPLPGAGAPAATGAAAPSAQ